jgi:hypothetical protein
LVVEWGGGGSGTPIFTILRQQSYAIMHCFHIKNAFLFKLHEVKIL